MNKWSVRLCSCLTAVVLMFLIMAEGNPVPGDLYRAAGTPAGRKDCRIEEQTDKKDPAEMAPQAVPAEEAETAAGSDSVTGTHPANETGAAPVTESGVWSQSGASSENDEEMDAFTADESYRIMSSEHTAALSEKPAEAVEDGGADNAYSLSDYPSNEILVCYKNGDIRLIQCAVPSELEEQIALLENDSSVDFCQPNFEYSADVIETSYLDPSHLRV